MTVMKSALQDNLIAGILILMMAVLSWTAVQNNRALSLIQRCVLETGDLCKGDPDATQKLLDSLVTRINTHTDEVHGK